LSVFMQHLIRMAVQSWTDTIEKLIYCI
jgi:hypothetical protein